jgi:two-component system phosphate regulon sensor histidine kinase PhoR
MNKNLIKIIIIVVSFVLLSLTAVQFYWVRNAISIERTNFENQVSNAINDVIDVLERIKTYRSFDESIRAQNKMDTFLQSLDSINHVLFESMYSPKTTDDIEKIIRKTNIVQEVISEMMNDTRQFDIEKDFDFVFLDSLLHKKIEERGITTNFEYGIYSTAKAKLIYQDATRYKSELENKGYVFDLLPYEISDDSYYLLIYFPYETRFLFKQMASIIFISLILIVIILMLFIFVIKIIVWQKRLSEMKNDFINNMTHEIKTPISTISLACEALGDEAIKKSPMLADNYLKVINDENTRLGGIAEKILQAAAIEKDNFRLKRERINIHELIDRVINNIGIQIEVKDGSIQCNYQAVKTFLNCDKMHLTSVISNLIDNANKYSPRKPEIKITTDNYADGIKVCVSDNGMGISKDNQRKIFDKLYRVPTGNLHDVKGFGLGLSYVKTIVEQHGGRITVDSTLQKGSTFCLYLPFSGKKKQTKDTE